MPNAFGQRSALAPVFSEANHLIGITSGDGSGSVPAPIIDNNQLVNAVEALDRA